MILSMEKISKSFGAAEVLHDITAKIEDRDKIGLIGPNGAGKSTLLSILYGELEPDAGTLSRSSASFGFQRQNSGLNADRSIIAELRSVFYALYEMERESKTLEALIASTPDSAPDYGAYTARYGQLQELFEKRDGYLIEVKISAVLNGMGFQEIDRETPVGVLSGGEKTRLALCKLLLEDPDLLILDEPTNHLDFKTLQWLEDYLQSYRGALLVVSHDRFFLDKLCTTIWDLEERRLSIYNANYSQYLILKAQRVERQLKEYEIQQQGIADLKDFVARNLVRATTSARAKSRRKVLDNMDIIERPRPPVKPSRISFSYKREPVRDVLHVEDLTIVVGEPPEEKQLYSGLAFDMLRGEKIALIGANGVGKSSLLKAIQCMIPCRGGSIRWGRNTDVSYFDQEDSLLHPEKTVLQEVWDRFPRLNEHIVRTTLGHVQLTGENVFKQVGDLSGGERARLKFAILMLTGGNVLLLDEPTNHLDLPTKEVLDRALQSYTGSLLVISHDRYLLNKFPTKIAEMHSNGIKWYTGNYDSYVAQKSLEVHTPASKSQPNRESKPTSYRTKKQRSEEVARKNRIAELEGRITALEQELSGLEQDIARPELMADYQKMEQAGRLMEEKRNELDKAILLWSELYE